MKLNIHLSLQALVLLALGLSQGAHAAVGLDRTADVRCWLSPAPAALAP
ncbi:hypothetical protein [Pseudomonas reactans]|nr:hypothetical protein [Pseudomonas reactans]NWA70211.1 hypothetical protein [Pseudomonas reactans]